MSIPSEALPVTAPARLREIDDLPSPRGLPLLGNMLQIDLTTGDVSEIDMTLPYISPGKA